MIWFDMWYAMLLCYIMLGYAVLCYNMVCTNVRMLCYIMIWCVLL